MSESEMFTHDWHAARVAKRAPISYRKRILATPAGKQATRALDDAVMEQNIAARARVALGLAEYNSTGFDETDVDTRPDTGIRAPDIDLSKEYSPEAKRAIRKEQDNELKGTTFDEPADGEHTFVPDHDPLERFVLSHSSHARPAQTRKDRSRMERIERRCDNPLALSRWLEKFEDEGEEPLPAAVYKARCERDELRNRRQRCGTPDATNNDETESEPKLQLGVYGLKLTALPSPLTPDTGRGKRKRRARVCFAQDGPPSG